MLLSGWSFLKFYRSVHHRMFKRDAGCRTPTLDHRIRRDRPPSLSETDSLDVSTVCPPRHVRSGFRWPTLVHRTRRDRPPSLVTTGSLDAKTGVLLPVLICQTRRDRPPSLLTTGLWEGLPGCLSGTCSPEFVRWTSTAGFGCSSAGARDSPLVRERSTTRKCRRVRDGRRRGFRSAADTWPQDGRLVGGTAGQFASQVNGLKAYPDAFWWTKAACRLAPVVIVRPLEWASNPALAPTLGNLPTRSQN